MEEAATEVQTFIRDGGISTRELGHAHVNDICIVRDMRALILFLELRAEFRTRNIEGVGFFFADDCILIHHPLGFGIEYFTGSVQELGCVTDFLPLEICAMVLEYTGLWDAPARVDEFLGITNHLARIG